MAEPTSRFCFAEAKIAISDIHETPSKLTPLSADNWTQNIPYSDHVQFFRSVDWSSTPLGDLSKWPTALRLHCFTLFADSRPSCIYWYADELLGSVLCSNFCRGSSKVAIYNELFIPLAARAHPSLMGSTFEEAFPDIWGTIEVVFQEAKKSGIAADMTEQQLFVERNGLLEETYFTGNFNPLRGDDGYIHGFYNSVYGEKFPSTRARPREDGFFLSPSRTAKKRSGMRPSLHRC
jgi:hypothetical protein